jgi:hypothetical protein
MATTTNYGWDTPDDTDLVKDGAAAIRTLGSSIDTTTKNLNPQTTTGALAYRSATANVNTALPIGSTGQVLTVAAGVPSWASPSDQTPLTTKGDVFTFSTVDARLGVGANGTVLTADSAETTGLKWATPAAGPSFAGCGLTASAQSISNNTTTIVNFGTELFDTDSFHSTVTNTGRITVPSGKAGKYLLSFILQWQTPSATGRRYGGITYYNSANAAQFSRFAEITPNGTSYPTLMGSAIIDAVVGDYFVIEVNQASGSAMDIQGNFDASYLGA